MAPVEDPKPAGSTPVITATAQSVSTSPHEEIYEHLEEHKNRRVIAIAIDASQHSDYCFNYAMDNIVTKDDQVCLLNVRPLTQLMGPFTSPYADISGIYHLFRARVISNAHSEAELSPVPTMFSSQLHAPVRDPDWVEKLEAEAKEDSHNLLKNYGAKVLKRGIACRAIALRGDPRDELVAKVDELKATCLIMGSRGMGQFKRALLGSVSDYCVHHANYPVLVVRERSA
ncbi:hypothetical protein BJ742DRAFT_785462 [Cladochytrium replicatum]|nr:hypothetical protein BJ742DRAFT_785462 [Cladochytrium replicatum]